VSAPAPAAAPVASLKRRREDDDEEFAAKFPETKQQKQKKRLAEILAGAREGLNPNDQKCLRRMALNSLGLEVPPDLRKELEADVEEPDKKPAATDNPVRVLLDCTSGVFFGFIRLPFSLSHTPACLPVSFSCFSLLFNRTAAQTDAKKAGHLEYDTAEKYERVLRECLVDANGNEKEPSKFEDGDANNPNDEGPDDYEYFRHKSHRYFLRRNKTTGVEKLWHRDETTKKWQQCFDDVSAEALAIELFKKRLEDSLAA